MTGAAAGIRGIPAGHALVPNPIKPETMQFAAGGCKLHRATKVVARAQSVTFTPAKKNRPRGPVGRDRAPMKGSSSNALLMPP